MKKAFTLIEVMVVLSVLAIIAILAYNFFGGTMKEATTKQAATKIMNDMTAIEQAYRLYSLDNTEPASGFDVDGASVLVTSGKLKSAPSPDSSILNGGLTKYHVYVKDYTGHGGGGDITENGADITGIVLYNVKDDICKAFNGAYTTLGSIVWDYQGNASAWPSGKESLVGLEFLTADVDKCHIVYVIDYNY